MDLNLTPNSFLLYTHLTCCLKVFHTVFCLHLRVDLSNEVRNVAPVITLVLKHFRF